MKLAKKNMIYSMLLAGTLLCFILGYFILMLPSLYVDHTNERNLNSVVEQHRGYLADRSYAQVSVNNPTACFTIEIPFHEEGIYVTTKAVRGQIIPEDEVMKEIVEELRTMLREMPENFSQISTEEWEERLKQQLSHWEELWEASEYRDIMNHLPVSLKILSQEDFEGMFAQERMRYHRISGELYVVEMSVEDQNNRYINYVAFSMEEESFVMSYLPVMAPQLTEIRPVVVQSLPMIAAVLILFVLVFSMLYSKGIVRPIVRLASQTKRLRAGEQEYPDTASHCRACGTVFPESETGACEEIVQLSETIRELYEELQENCRLLEESNRQLSEKNKRQEVFLRASSHQLKTPIAAALLLVEGMMSRIGKYEDRDRYLPEVKQQLLYMRKIVEEILYLNRMEEETELSLVEPEVLIRGQLSNYDIMIREKNLTIKIEPKAETGQEAERKTKAETEYGTSILTNEALFEKIADNLMSNAVSYTPPDGEIRLQCQEDRIVIRNSGVQIPEEMLPHIFEPFVSGSMEGSCRGLGLYIACYYAERLGMQIVITNEQTQRKAGQKDLWVKTELILKNGREDEKPAFHNDIVSGKS